MNSPNDVQQTIREAKNICVVTPPQTNEPESTACALALFYTLRELKKNVNLVLGDFPEKLTFLVPSMDLIASPKNFVISIPQQVANVSQIYYEKNNQNLEIHLTLERGNIKKEQVAFYFSEPKPDLVITLGIKNFQQQLANSMDSFGFLLGAPIINIDAAAEHPEAPENLRFGHVNLVESQPISYTTLQLIRSLEGAVVSQPVANCILTGLVTRYDNFKSQKTTPEVLKTAAELIEKGADHRQIVDNLNKTSQAQMSFLTQIFRNLQQERGVYVSALPSDEFWNFGQTEAAAAMDKIRNLALEESVLTLWKSHASSPTVKGFFYSRKPGVLAKVAEQQKTTAANDWVFIAIPGDDLEDAKNRIISLVA